MKYLSLFSGIGGFELGITQAYESTKNSGLARERECDSGTSGRQEALDSGGVGDTQTNGDMHDSICNESPTCIGFSEIDKYAIQIYQKHFPEHKNYGDITQIKAEELPAFDLLVGGFPCQSFSIAGKRGGFSDTRGTMFFEIARILAHKRPRLVLLENVKGLLSHDNGKTFARILEVLTDIGYELQWEVLNSKNFGVPQNRERVFIVGHLRGTTRPNVFPLEKHEHNNIEKVYWLQKGVSQDARALLQEFSLSAEKYLPKQQMQKLLTLVRQGIQKGECREVSREEQIMDADTKRSLQVVEELESWTQSADKSGGLCGVVQIPTEEVLLLWAGGDTASISFRHLQQQDVSFERGQGGLLERIRNGESGALLLAVQSHQGRLLYSIGDGRDWEIIHSKPLEKWNTTLSSILEEQVDQKYFLSAKATEAILRNSINPDILTVGSTEQTA